MYAMDSVYNKNSSKVELTKDYRMVVKRDKCCEYVLKSEKVSDFVYTCLTSDFFHSEADKWIVDAWNMIKERQDLKFLIFTKRIDRFYIGLPTDWHSGYENVYIAVSCENQRCIDDRLSVFMNIPVRHKFIMLAPLLEEVDITDWLKLGSIEQVIVGGENSINARPLYYDWVLKVRQACLEYNIGFHFQQTGSVFIKDGRKYKLNKHALQMEQAKKASIDLDFKLM